ncbi:MAG: aminoglycoside phosphotransferase [Verrucomicrobiales bacterium]|nr:aminoglycoside phosphotransferase [Verrucomicrobiales bacterium]
MSRRPKVTEKSAAAVLQYHFQKKPKKIRELHGGLVNFVFEAEVEKDRLIVRISEEPAKLQVYLKEQWAVGKAREKGVPTPDILEVSTEAIGMPYMVSRKNVGKAAHLYPNRIDICRQMGRYAAIINSIPTSDFGEVFDWSRNKLSRKKTWTEYLQKELNGSGRIEFFEKEKLISKAAAIKLKAQLVRANRLTNKPSLNHGDIRLKNVLLDEKGQVSVILDWEECTSNLAPWWELSIALHDLGIDEKEALLQGYGISFEEFSAMVPTVKLLNILNYWTAISEAHRAKDKKRLESLALRLSGALDLFSIG